MGRLKSWIKRRGTNFVYAIQKGRKVVLPSPGQMNQPLNYARSAVKHVRSVLPIGECNRESNVKETCGWSTEAVVKLRQDRASFGAFLKNGVTEMKNMLDDYLVAVGKDDELADMDWDETIEPLTAPLPSLLLLPRGLRRCGKLR
ncbi:MAG: hypothetical protein MI863_27770 [Desulfobacterales bacterium]|nr:hypothetical protein [Desulfobacterales bacterium]